MIAAVALAFFLGGIVNRARGAEGERVELVISGGHETDARDHGRPVVLIGNALGVTPEVFREAFSHVTPAPGGSEPEPGQVQRNKAALLGALGKYGVTNDFLDRVSNYYRYQPGRGQLWPTSNGAATAIIKDGAVTSIQITKAGGGYSSPPKVSIPRHPEIALNATLAFGKDLKSNGSIAAISVTQK